ncbi:Uma2 family endonuclease [Actinoplanes oblitus]|uniref:Uma2 family endonuclease n=1 Tax=Actinoplanes oblitus TaxID=3040509 RepID=A0ABY8WQK2_9ACTN|nr:Uma2 family endonuclease [Actinoplanes oblitus]WIM98848.1 Uma2 family endonuclease [Actinoplanes oblitus]
MSRDAFADRMEPWSEEEYLALGETHSRIELIDGSLWVSPAPNVPHQAISNQLIFRLHRPARDAGLRALPTINLRLAPGRIVIPDIVVGGGPRVATVGEATDVLLVCEITSPSNAATDRLQKRSFYAEAHIPWYLLVEPDFLDYESVTVRLFRLVDKGYVEHATAKQGETLTSELPFPLSISTDDLLDF